MEKKDEYRQLHLLCEAAVIIPAVWFSESTTRLVFTWS